MTTLDKRALDAAIVAWKFPRQHDSVEGNTEAAITAYLAALSSIPERGVGVEWPEPTIINPDIAQPTGIPYLDSLIHRVLDAQQDINFAANEQMSQPLADASALMDEVETAIRKFSAAPSHPAAVAVTEEMVERACRQEFDDWDRYVADPEHMRWAEDYRAALRRTLEAALVDRDRVK